MPDGDGGAPAEVEDRDLAPGVQRVDLELEDGRYLLVFSRAPEA